MKRALRLLLLTPFLFSGVGCKQKQNMKPVDVVIISGQSNAVGCTHSDQIMDCESLGVEKYTDYMTGYKDIQIAYDNWTLLWDGLGNITGRVSQNKSRKDNFVKVQLGQGNGPETFGPEIGIAEAMHEKYANKLFLIKFACGGSSLKGDWVGRSSYMYPKMIEYIDLQISHLKEKGFTPRIKAFCWMQGEGDSYGSDYYNVYRDNLATFVGDMREDLAKYATDKGIAFIDATINPDKSVWPNPDKVNAQKELFAAESDMNFLINTHEAGMHTDQEPWGNVDKCHYDSESEVLLGHLFAEAFEPFLDPVEE